MFKKLLIKLGLMKVEEPVKENENTDRLFKIYPKLHIYDDTMTLYHIIWEDSNGKSYNLSEFGVVFGEGEWRNYFNEHRAAQYMEILKSESDIQEHYRIENKKEKEFLEDKEFRENRKKKEIDDFINKYR